MNNIALDQAEEFVIELVKKAGKIALDYQSKSNLKHKSKGISDFATEGDLAVENFLKENLAKKFPESNFLMEESAPENFSDFKDKNNLWVIDPIDGTANFSRGSSYFAISIGLVNSGKTQLGIVYQPAVDNLYLARVDKNEATLNGKEIKVSSISNLNEVNLITGLPWNLKKKKTILNWINNLTDHLRQIKINGSASLDICLVAKGEADGFLITGVYPWDLAAASLILEKAGGKITQPNRKDWDIFEESILATNNLIHQKILNLLK